MIFKRVPKPNEKDQLSERKRLSSLPACVPSLALKPPVPVLVPSLPAEEVLVNQPDSPNKESGSESPPKKCSKRTSKVKRHRKAESK
mmetsp:Transcript_18955/g.21775  ORF Transcript_18955/g.21775 Transcript_18955/m.21775 type:complete len:87 (+) Transcript_18955:42-302(+)